MSTPNILDVALSDLTPSEIATILPNILILEQKLSKTGHALDIARIDLYLEKKCLHGSIDRSFARIAKYRRKVSFYDHYKKQVQQALIALTKNSSSLFPPEAQYTISEILSEGVSRVASADYDQITSYQGRKMALAQYEEELNSKHTRRSNDLTHEEEILTYKLAAYGMFIGRLEKRLRDCIQEDMDAKHALESAKELHGL